MEKIITNKFLKKISIHPNEEIYYATFESPELEAIDKAMDDMAVIKGFVLMLKNKEKFLRLYKKFKSDEEMIILLQFSTLVYFIELIDKTEMRRQLKHCEEFLRSDICKRNVMLLNELGVEAEKLKSAIDTDHVKQTCTFLDNEYKKHYKKWSKTERYVRISEVLKIFSIPGFPHFYDMEEATEYLSKNNIETSSPRKFIVDKIKHYIID